MNSALDTSLDDLAAEADSGFSGSNHNLQSVLPERPHRVLRALLPKPPKDQFEYMTNQSDNNSLCPDPRSLQKDSTDQSFHLDHSASIKGLASTSHQLENVDIGNTPSSPAKVPSSSALAPDLPTSRYSTASPSYHQTAAGTSNTMGHTHPTNPAEGAPSLGSPFGSSPNAAGTPGSLKRKMAEPDPETLQVSKKGAGDEQSSTTVEHGLLSPQLQDPTSSFSSSTGLSGLLSKFPPPPVEGRPGMPETLQDQQHMREHETKETNKDDGLFRTFTTDILGDNDADTPAADEVPVAFPIPPTIWCALEEHYTAVPPRDNAEAIYQMGVQYGIGLGISSYKKGLTEELLTKGTLFGREVVVDKRRTAADVKHEIEARDSFDRAMAGQGYLVYDHWNNRVKEKVGDLSIEELAEQYGGPGKS